MADPQFGMFAFLSDLTDADIEDRRRRGITVRKAPRPITGFADETRLYTSAIEAANRLRPAFVVVCGDMVHDASDQTQIAELFRITTLLDDDVPIHFVSGNHDVGDSPTSESIDLYRSRFGADNYSFDHDGCHFVVINSSVASDPANVPREWDRVVQFLVDDMSAARRAGVQDIVLFTHHPLFENRADEDDGYFTIPRSRRQVLVDALEDYGATAVFAGHMHRNCIGREGDLRMITTGAVGYPLGDDPSGLRVVRMYEDGIEHDYYSMDAIPDIVTL